MPKNTAGSSRTPQAASAPNVHALSVNASSFVSVKLSGRHNYKIWKAQMLCLVESQALLYIIEGKVRTPEDKQYDHLVKGWIFGSIDEKVLEGFVDLGTANDVWKKLEDLHKFPKEAPAPKDFKITSAISDSVTTKLSGWRNYESWKKQMISYLKGEHLHHIIDPNKPFPEEKDVHNIPKYDNTVKDWIEKNMEKSLYNKHFNDLKSARAVWGRLEYAFKMP